MSAVAELDLPAFDYADESLRGPRFHEALRELRERTWVARADPVGWFVLDREAVTYFLRTQSLTFPGRKMLEVQGVTEGPLYERLRGNLLDLDGENHRRLRKLVQPTFTPPAADRYRPAMRSILAELYADLGGAGRCDFVRAFAKPYPARMIATVIGAPLEDAERLHELSNLLQSQFDAIALATRREELEAAAVEFDAYVEQLVSARRDDPGDDLVSKLIVAEEEGDRLTHDECVGLVRDALNGGIDTTQSQLAHGMRLLAGHPDQWRLLGDDPSLAARAAEEVLRFEPVAPFTTRLLLEEIEYRGVLFPADTVVTVSQFSANRDMEGGDAFDISVDRGSMKALTFGAGPHFCMGANLARAELQEGLAFLSKRMGSLELDGEPVFDSVNGIYGLLELPIRFTPRGAPTAHDPR